jgi:uncharacterized protein YydD (DUF2326 family)
MYEEENNLNRIDDLEKENDLRKRIIELQDQVIASLKRNNEAANKQIEILERIIKENQ